MLQLRNKKSDKGPLWLVEPKYSIGADSSCDIVLVGASIDVHHADLVVDGDTVFLLPISQAADILVNGALVSGKIQLNAGDQLALGSAEFELLDPKSVRKPAAIKPVAAQSGWSLKALNTALAEKQFPLTGSATLGRSKECDISLGVVHLSRQHAKITVTDRGLLVQDLQSSNGTFVNGKKIDRSMLVAGDELSFDTLRFKIIGPSLDDDRTTVRPAADADLTTIRPAVNIPGAKPGASGSMTPKAPARPKPAGNRPRKAPSSVSPEGAKPSSGSVDPVLSSSTEGLGGGGGKLILVLGLALVGIIAAGLFLLQSQ